MAKIKNYSVLKEVFGYFPTFHDDIISEINIKSDEILIRIDFETLPQNSDAKSVEIKITDIIDIDIEGEFCGEVSIIFELEFNKKEDLIELEISTSMGISGVIRARNFEFNLI